MQSLENRIIAITGGAGGIARGIAEAIREQGGRVALIDLSKSQVENALMDLTGGDAIMGFTADVTDPASLERVFAAIVAGMGRLDGLVSNAGVIRMAPAEKAQPADLDLELAVNVKGVLLSAQAAARHFGPEGGAIVNIASNAGKVGYPNMIGYNASKAAVISLTRTLSLEWAERGINVNAVCPGGVATDMLKSVADFITGGEKAESEKMLGQMLPRQLGRHIEPVEVGRVVAFLLSDAAKIIRGQSISVDGGDTPF